MINIYVNFFNKYFVNVAEGIGFSDELPEDYFTEAGFQTIIRKHAKHKHFENKCKYG